MDLANLQTFIAVAESGSFSAAAERLHLTQPAISKRVAALEASLGTSLFDRLGRRVSPTEAGRALLPNARRVLEALEDGRRAIGNLSGAVAGRLQIATSHHIGLHRLPPVLRAYSAAYPQVELDIRFMDSEAACQAVEQGELELGIVTLPPVALPRLEVTPIWHDPLRVAVTREHPLPSSGRLPPRELARHPAVLPARGTYTREIVEAGFARHGLQPMVKLSTNYLETLKMLVSVGLGWSVLPDSMLDEEIRALEVGGFAPSRQLGIVRHRGRTLSNAGLALVALLEQHADAGTN